MLLHSHNNTSLAMLTDVAVSLSFAYVAWPLGDFRIVI